MSRKRPVSGTRPYRLPVIGRKRMNAAQRALYAALASGPRTIGAELAGPFQVWLNAPEFGLRAQALGVLCRFQTTLPARLSETAILATAHWWKAQYEWHAHEPLALKAGVTPAAIAEIRRGRIPRAGALDERAICEFIREFYATRRVSDRIYRRVQRFLGDRGSVELVGIAGYYALISMTLNAFHAPLPPGSTPAFAEPPRKSRRPRTRPAA